MSRREYKTIRRRMEAGRLAAIKEGNFIISSPPYGYKKTNPAPKIHTLEVVPEEAEVIKLIYDMYVNQHFGKRKIATALNSMGIKPPRSDWWEGISIRKILCNPVYMGYNQWHSKSNGDTLYKGLHEPIISKELYEQAQERRINRKTSSTTSENTLKNYYSGLLYCESCGKCMQRRTIEKPSGIKIEHMVCRTTKCNTVSSRTDIIDEAVLTALKVHLAQLKNKSSGINNNNTQNENTIDVISMIKSEICDLKKQKNKLHDLLEREIYDENTYLERQSIVAQKLKEAEKALSNAEKITTQKISDEQAIINIELLLENFSSADPLQKKELLSNVVRRIEYSKTSDLRGIHNKKESNMTIKCFFI
ncbi:putative recombinase [Ruminococcus sp. CAG:353]|nr:putative recombinase [Ruminococcus sp. CAG:353]